LLRSLNNEIDLVLADLDGNSLLLFSALLVEATLDLFTAHEQGVGRNTHHEENIRSDRAACADGRISAKDDSVGIDRDVVLHPGMTSPDPLDRA